MFRAISVAALCLLAASVHSQDKSKDTKGPSPTEAVKAWNDALYKGDVKIAAALTSKTSMRYIEKSFGSLEALSAIYQKNRDGLNVTKNIHEEISGDSAIVVYRVQYGARKIKYWMDKLIREDGLWKVAPQYVQTLPLRE